MTNRVVIEILHKHRRALELGLVMIAVLWHVGNDLPASLANRSAYRSFALVLVIWMALMILLSWAGWRILGANSRAAGIGPALAALTLCMLAIGLCRPGTLVSMANWGFGSTGWLLLPFLIRQRRWEIPAILAGPAATLVALWLFGGWSAFPSYLVAAYAICALQLLMAAGANVVLRSAEAATVHKQQADEMFARRNIADVTRSRRLRRYRNIQTTVEPVLEGLADGSLSPADPAVQAQCARLAARLRRSCAVPATPHPLTDTVEALADQGDLRGVKIEAVMSEDLPAMPASIVAALTAPAAAAIQAATSYVKLTTLTTADSVTFAGIGDHPPLRIEPVNAAVEVKSGSINDEAWWEATWTHR